MKLYPQNLTPIHELFETLSLTTENPLTMDSYGYHNYRLQKGSNETAGRGLYVLKNEDRVIAREIVLVDFEGKEDDVVVLVPPNFFDGIMRYPDDCAQIVHWINRSELEFEFVHYSTGRWQYPHVFDVHYEINDRQGTTIHKGVEKINQFTPRDHLPANDEIYTLFIRALKNNGKRDVANFFEGISNGAIDLRSHQGHYATNNASVTVERGRY